MPVDVNQRIIATGDISSQTFPGRGGNHMHLFRAEELKLWLARSNLSIVQMSASNGLSLRWNEWLSDNRSDTAKWEYLLNTELEACAEEGSLNMGTHMIAVVQKEQ